jgi:hypothetical protein
MGVHATERSSLLIESQSVRRSRRTRLRLPGLDSPLTWRLGVSTPQPPYLPINSLYATDLQPAPNAPLTTAIVTGAAQYLPYVLNVYGGYSGGITIFDNATARPTEAPDVTPAWNYYFKNLQWGSDDSTLYSGDSNFYALNVTASGVTPNSRYFGLLNDSNLKFDSGTGYLYNNAGQVIDPSNGTIVGTYPSSGLLVPDSSLNTVFILGQTTAQKGTYDFTITSYNQKTFEPVSSIAINSIAWMPLKLIRWGTSGLALITYSQSNDETQVTSGMLYIFNEPAFVTATAAAARGDAPEEVQRTWSKQRLPFPNLTTQTRSHQR